MKIEHFRRAKCANRDENALMVMVRCCGRRRFRDVERDRTGNENEIAFFIYAKHIYALEATTRIKMRVLGWELYARCVRIDSVRCGLLSKRVGDRILGEVLYKYSLLKNIYGIDFVLLFY